MIVIIASTMGCGGGGGGSATSALDEVSVAPDFNYPTITPVSLGVAVNDAAGLPRPGIVVTVYTEGGSRIAAGMTGADGHYQQFIAIPIDHRRLIVTAGILGTENQAVVDVSPNIDLVFE